MIRVLIAARSAMARAGLEALVKTDADDLVVSGSTDLAGLAAAIDETSPDVILADLDRLDEESPAGLEEAARAQAALVMLADDPPQGWIFDALRSGAAAVLPRDAPAAQILAAISAAALGLVVLDPRDLSAVMARPPVPATMVEHLTPREADVLKMLAEGLSNKLIAGELGISEHTVKFHVNSILGKLNAGSRTEAVTIGVRRGLLIL